MLPLLKAIADETRLRLLHLLLTQDLCGRALAQRLGVTEAAVSQHLKTMLFLCGLFFPIAQLPVFLKPLSYLLPLTYGVDIPRWGFVGKNLMPLPLDFGMLLLFCAVLFWMSLRNIRRRWIA